MCVHLLRREAQEGSNMTALRINDDRLWQSLMEMARIGATPRGGVCRVALTDVDRQGRELFVRWAREAGCEVEIDQMGNIFARRSGADNTRPPVLTGSHLIRNPPAGSSMGSTASWPAWKCFGTLNDHHYATRRPVEVVVWTNEEGSRFAPAMVASGVFAGEFPLDYGLSRSDLNGVTIGQELDRIGYAGLRACGGQPVHAYFEAHIEQGPILEAERRIIGVVQGLQGQRWFDCTIQGMESHAGTTPMPRRHDALLGAARMIQAVQEAALSQAPHGVGTVGQLLVHPNSRNVIPGRVDFSVDLRHPDDEALKAMAEAVRTAVDRLGDLGLTGTLKEIWYAPPTLFHPDCIAAVRRAAEDLTLPSYGHDQRSWSRRQIPGAGLPLSNDFHSM